MNDQDCTEALTAAVMDAAAQKTPLNIQGGGTKAFYGREPEGEPLDMAAHRGILHYAPSELVVTARSGTPLREIEAALKAKRQMLPFEPPHFGAQATLGGMVAAGLSGPRRFYAGAVRDNVLGVKILNGQGAVLHFGGEVMKNVAGYDLSRLMVGALGTLGVLLEVSLKVLPRPDHELTLALALDPAAAITQLNAWARQALPISATYYDGAILYLRLSGSEQALEASTRILSSERRPGAQHHAGVQRLDWGEVFWTNVREQADAFFMDDTPLWRLTVPPATPPLPFAEQVIEWGGALRWVKSTQSAQDIRRIAEAVQGHPTLFRNGLRTCELFHPLPKALMRLHHNLKRAFDPAGILNPHRLYPDF